MEADIRLGLPAFTVVGLADKAVREARERVRAAMVNSGYEFPLRRITVNLAPAYLRKVGPAFDLPLAVGAAGRLRQLDARGDRVCAVVGELSLTGEVRRGARARSRSPRASGGTGCARLVLPARAGARGRAGAGHRGRRRSTRCRSSSRPCAGTRSRAGLPDERAGAATSRRCRTSPTSAATTR